MEDASVEAILERLKKIANVTTDIGLSKNLGLSKQSIAAARTRGEIPASWLPKAAMQFGISMDWLYFGRGSMRVGGIADPVHTAVLEVQPTETTTQNACLRCAELKKELTEEREERREIARENRQLWKENAALREEVAAFRATAQQAAAPDQRRCA